VSPWQVQRTDDRIEVAGDLRLSDGEEIWRALREVATNPPRSLDIDLSPVTAIDGSIMALVVDLRASLIAQRIRSEIVGGNPGVRDLVHLLHGDRPVPRHLPPPRIGAIGRLGTHAQRLIERGYARLSFTGEFAASLRRPWGANARSIPSLIVRAGADGVPIVVVLNFLVGFVMAFQSMQTLELYSANIYVADIVGIAVTRELGARATRTLDKIDRAADDLEHWAGDLRGARIPARAARTLDRMDAVAAKLDRALDQLSGTRELIASAKRATDSLGEVGRTMRAVSGDLARTIRDLGDAARSVREFMDALEREPDMLITGRARAR
jgi:ABC-type transporter Mla MlaB component